MGSTSAPSAATRYWPRAFVSERGQLGVTALWVVGTTLVALLVSDLGSVLGLVGASAGMLTAFIVPAGCYVRLAPHWNGTRCAAVVLLVASIALTPLVVAVELNLLDET